MHKKCPECGREVVITASLRPDNWPNALLYHVCNYCSWEEKNLLKKDSSYLKKLLASIWDSE